MLLVPARLVQEATSLQRETVERWHREPIDNPYDGLLSVVCQQHQFNFLLWHEEDVARSPHVGDARIAQVKRAIDRFNQQRNDHIEKIDDYLQQELRSHGVATAPDALLNTETPGSAIDRLSIMSLRIYHLHEQLARTDAGPEHWQMVQPKLDLCYQQHRDLANSLAQLLDEIFSGRKQLKLYRQMKMYNDPALNPQLYQNPHRKAG